MMNIKKLTTSLMLGAFLVSCTNNLPEGLKTYKAVGTAGGAATGAVVGNLIGGDRTSTLIGAGLGAAAGFGLGYYLDNQEKELKASLANTGARVQRNGNEINIILPEGVTFETNSYKIERGFYRPLMSIAQSLNKYPESKIVIEGHTDSTGNKKYNLNLSEKRASSVKQFLYEEGVSSRRMRAYGFGDEQPIASNSTPSGRQANRRVEIKIISE